MLTQKLLTAGKAEELLYIEDVFSTYLYTGVNSGSITVNNGIDLASKGGMVWIKTRNLLSPHSIQDTTMGTDFYLRSNTTDGRSSAPAIINYTTTGFTLPTGYNQVAYPNTSNYVSWTFRKKPKFFDVVTYTGDGTSNRQIAHNLGSVPGAMIVKTVSTTGYWWVYHRSLANTEYLELNGTYAKATSANMWASTTPTDTYFTVSAGTNLNNTSGTTYVAYLFAHDAGGFGLTGTDNVISCGSFTTDSGGAASITLGYEPQWILLKQSGAVGNWQVFDNLRGFATQAGSTPNPMLNPNLSSAESSEYPGPLSTGFNVVGYGASTTWIYIAIRRGPMKVPTSGTSVFVPVARTGTGSIATVTTGIVTDTVISGVRNGSTNAQPVFDRLRGASIRLISASTAAEISVPNLLTGFDNNTGYIVGAEGTTSGTSNINRSSINYVNWCFQRAPSFFDEVCYTGTGSTRTITHNLGVAPELVIIKSRSAATGWAVTCYPALTSPATDMFLQTTAEANPFNWITSPTSTTLTIGPSNQSSVNTNTATYVAYLFATCAGVSKVGSYTGTGTTQQINCGFTGGSRFVLIKRTDSTGDWYVWDSARGIVAGNDPYLLLNSTAAEVTSTDYVDTYSAGFEISSTAPAAINASGGTFIFLAIA